MEIPKLANTHFVLPDPETLVNKTMCTSLQLGRLLNEARILLEQSMYGDIEPARPAIADFEKRCHELLGPIIRLDFRE